LSGLLESKSKITAVFVADLWCFISR